MSQRVTTRTAPRARTLREHTVHVRTDSSPSPRAPIAGLCGLLVLLLLVAYANHFENGFHFDDSHTVISNPFIRDLRNIPRFFTDPTLFSTMPEHATWRPLVSVSLAIDYWLGGGLKPFFFHFSTLAWFAVQVVLMFFLFRHIMDRVRPRPFNVYTAFLAAACYALHPANAETVNYVIQRGDLYGTLGVVASLLWYIARPAARRRGWYLLPAAAAFLSKAPALIYPFLLLAYIYLFEQDEAKPAGAKWRAAFRASLPAFLVAAAAAVLTARMTPHTFNAGAASPALYRLTQPWIVLHYLKSFFLPTELSADTDLTYVDGPFSAKAVLGCLAVAGLVWLIVRTARRPEMRPVAFGLAWFLLALAPTSLMPLAEVANDHRMFFAFVGLALAVFWPVGQALSSPRAGTRIAARVAVGLALAAALVGTWQRNEVWRSDESLWRDVTIKSPRNGRGLMNYGLVFLERGNYPAALRYFERALAYTPNYWSLEINLGIAYGALHRDAEAERHLRRAVELAPWSADPDFFYARWLRGVGRIVESAAALEAALRINPRAFDARDLLLEVYAQQPNWGAFDRLARETLEMDPANQTARRLMAVEQAGGDELRALEQRVRDRPAAQDWLELSHRYYQGGRYWECLSAARAALALEPDYADAYNNLAAANNALGRWGEGIAAAREAVRLAPDNQLARNNLRWAIDRKK